MRCINSKTAKHIFYDEMSVLISLSKQRLDSAHIRCLSLTHLHSLTHICLHNSGAKTFHVNCTLRIFDASLILRQSFHVTSISVHQYENAKCKNKEKSANLRPHV